MPGELEAQTPPEDLSGVLAAYLQAADAGLVPDRAALLAAHPDLAGELREFFAAQDHLQRLGLPLYIDRALATPAETLSLRSELSTPGHAESRGEAAADSAALGGYEILGELGRGGMGVVYKARQTKLGRLVALKMVLAGSHAGPDELARFKTEAEAIARLQHPHIVQVHEVGEHDGRPFFSLEFCPGGSLAQKLAGTPLSPQEAAALVETLARAMQAAHAKGVIHRDLKPANVLLTEDGTPKITDFGLARKLDDVGQTQSGAIMGTPSYMAPEQASGRVHEVGPAADVYALGAILYECLTGRPPFRAATPLDTILQVVRDDPVSTTHLQPKVPRDLDTICLKCLQKELSRRYRSAADLADDLGRVLTGEPIQARPVGRVERLLKWARRRPAVAALLGTLAVAVVALAVGGVIYNARLEAALADATTHRRAAERTVAKLETAHGQLKKALGDEKTARKGEVQARGDAERALANEKAARRAALITLADTYTSLGLVAGEQGRLPEAVLLFANAVRLSASDPQRDWANRVRVRRWLRECYQPVHVVPGPDSSFRTVALHSGGRNLLTVARKNKCVLWDLTTEQKLTLPGGARGISGAAWSPDGNKLALAVAGGEVEVFTFPQGKRLAAITPPGPVRLLSFSGDGRYLAMAGGHARVWDFQENQYATEKLEHPQAVEALAFNERGDRVSTTCRDRLGRVFRVPGDGRPAFAPVRHYWIGPEEDIRNGRAIPPTFIDRDRGLLTVTDERTVAWRDATTGKVLRSVPFRSADAIPTIRCLVASPSGAHFLIGGYKSAQLWDVRAGKEIGAPLTHQMSVLGAAFSPDGRRVVTAGHDRVARVWSVPDGRPIGPPLPHWARVYLAQFTSEGDRMLTVQEWGPLHVWAPPPPDPRDAHLPLGDGSSLASLSPDGAFVISAGMTYASRRLRTICVWAVATGRQAGPVFDAGAPVTGAALSPDNRHAAVLAAPAIGKPGNLQIWDWRAGKRTVGPVRLPSEPRSVAYRPDGRQIAVFCAGGEIRLFDLAGHVVKELSQPARMSYPQDYVHNCALVFSPDGHSLASWVGGEKIRVWDVATGKLRYGPLELPGSEVRFSPDSRWLSAGLQVWDARTGKPAAKLQHPVHWVHGVQFSADGRRLATGGSDGMVRLWDWKAQREVCPPMFQPGGDVYAVALTPDGRCVVSSGFDRTVRIWDARSGRPIAPPLPISGGGLNVSVTPKGDFLAVGGFVAELHLFHLGDLREKDDLTADELCLMAEVLSQRQMLEGGAIANLSGHDWLQRRQRFRTRHPRFFEPDHGKPGLGPVLEAARLARHDGEAMVAASAGQWFAAIFHLDRLIVARPNAASLYTRRGLAYSALGRWPEARADYARVLRLRSNDIHALSNYALAFLAEGDQASYRQACQEMLARHGTATDFLRLRELVWTLVAGEGVANLERLTPSLEALVAQRPNECGPRHLLGPVLCRLGRYKEGVRQLTEAMRLHLGGKGELTDLVFLALAHHRLGDTAAAKHWLDRTDKMMAADPQWRGRHLGMWLATARLQRELAAALRSPKPG
jgi:WD40 repeat protein/Flp pilus assembly protein TadD/tRNA A-37 threonylcarbamoyl transferase component Bud32